MHAKKLSYGVLYQCMPSFISRKCLLDGQTLAKKSVMLATKVAQRRPKCPADYEEIARALSPIFSEDKKPVVLSGRACRERMNSLTFPVSGL